MHVVYTGELVRIRPFKDVDEHANTLEELSLEEDQFWGYGWSIRSRLNKQFEEHAAIGGSGRFSCFAIERLDTGETIGNELAVIPKPGRVRADIGTVLFKKHWSNGFGREAKLLAMCFLFENFALSCVGAATQVKHRRAIAGLEACRMTREGIWRCCSFSLGNYEDVVTYHIFREEWERLPIRQIVKRGE